MTIACDNKLLIFELLKYLFLLPLPPFSYSRNHIEPLHPEEGGLERERKGQELSQLSYFDETATGEQNGSSGLEVIDKDTISLSRRPKPAFMPKRACPFY